MARVDVNFLARRTKPAMLQGVYLNHHIIKSSSLEKLGYDDYLAISGLILLSYVVGVDVWLGEPCDIFRLRRDIFGCPTPYLFMYNQGTEVYTKSGTFQRTHFSSRSMQTGLKISQ